MDKSNLAFVLITVMTFVGLAVIAMTEDAEGAIVQSTFNVTDNNLPMAYSRDRGTHTKDDIVVISFCPDGDSLVVAYRERGGSWDYTTLHDSGEANSYNTGGVINTLNNSVVVWSSYKTGSYQDLHLWIKFPADDWDTWNDVFIYDNRIAVDIAINDTDQICLVSTYTTSTYTIKYWVYDFASLTVVVGDPSGSNIGTGEAANPWATVQVIANATGKFHFFWRNGLSHWWRDMDLTISKTQIGNNQYYPTMIAILMNDRFIAAGHIVNTGKSYYLYQDTHMDTSWTLVWLESSGRLYEYAGMGISIAQNSTFVRLVTYCNDVEKVTTWGAFWDASEVTWQGSRTDTGTSDADDIACYGNFGGLWPEHPSTGLKWTRPSAGWVVLGRDESGATDELDMIHDGLNWTVDLTTDDPLITTVSLPNGITNEDYSQALTKTGGTPPYLWTIQTAPEWLEINPSSGVLTGTCGDTGSYTVTVKLTEAAGRYDFATWTLKVTAVVSEAEPLPPGRSLDFPGISIDTLIGALWWLFMVMAMFIAIIDVVMKTRNKLEGGQS